MQNLKTICPHNAEGQVFVPGRPTRCRQCGAMVEPETQGVNASNQVSPAAIAAGYPGEPNA